MESVERDEIEWESWKKVGEFGYFKNKLVTKIWIIFT